MRAGPYEFAGRVPIGPGLVGFGLTGQGSLVRGNWSGVTGQRQLVTVKIVEDLNKLVDREG